MVNEMKQRKHLNEKEFKRNAYVEIWFENPIRSVAQYMLHNII